MDNKTLTQAQVKILKEGCKDLAFWLETDEGTELNKKHKDHEKYLKEKLSKKNLETLSAKEFGDIYKALWVSNMWNNKDWRIEHKLLIPNSIEKIRTSLSKLLYSGGNIAERYDEFKASVKGFGPSTLSEILHFVFPEKYCLWNEKPKTILPGLGLDILPKRFFDHQISTGEEYFKCVRALGLIKEAVANYGIRDFIDLDIMFLYMSGKTHSNEEDDKPIDTHTSAQYRLLKLGNMLGYLTYTPDYSRIHDGHKLGDIARLREMPPFAGKQVSDSASMIDVIWFGEDENPKACFEVEHTTSIKSGLHRLYQLNAFQVKFFIIASKDRRSKFEKEVKKAPYLAQRKRFRFISYNKLSEFFGVTSTFHELKMELMGDD